MTRVMRRFQTDKKGIEGLPLKLLIVVIITVVSLGILMVCLGQIGGPKVIKTVQVNPKYISIGTDESEKTVTINVTVYDANNEALAGVIVTLDGCNATHTPHETGKDGKVSITTTVMLPEGVDSGKIKVKAEKSGYQSGEATIYVYRG